MIECNKIFFDTAPYIYYLEKNPVYYDSVKRFFMESYDSDKFFVTSAITVEEYFIMPCRNQNYKLLNDFERLITDTQTDIVDISKVIAIKAAQIRAKHKYFKGMDALQLASAVASGCDLFFTNDKQLKQFNEIKVITIEEIKSNI